MYLLRFLVYPRNIFSRKVPSVNILPITRNNQRQSPISLRILYMCIYLYMCKCGWMCVYILYIHTHTRTVAIILSTIKVTLGPSSSCTKRVCDFVPPLVSFLWHFNDARMYTYVYMLYMRTCVYEKKLHSISRVYIYYLSIFFIHLCVYIYINLPVRVRVHIVCIYL